MNTSKQIYGLQEIFNELSYSHNEPIDIDDLLEFLDSRCPNGHFDRDVYQQLVEQIRSYPSGKVAINDFMDVVLKAQGVLNDKIIACSQSLDQKTLLLRQYNEKLNYSKFNEQSQTLSKMNIQVLEAHLMYQTVGSLQISIQCGNKIQQTCIILNQFIEFALKSQLQWNDSFDFNIYNQKDIIEIILVDSELSPKREIGGIAQLNIDTFNDQLVHDIWIDLGDRNSKLLKCRVHVKIQWIYSKSEYMNELIKQEQIDIEELSQQIKDHRIDLDLIAQPFIKPAKKLDQISKPSIPVIIQSYNTQQPQNEQLSNILLNLDDHIDQLVKMSLLGIILYLFIALFVCFNRCVFLDVKYLFLTIVFGYVLLFHILLKESQITIFSAHQNNNSDDIHCNFVGYNMVGNIQHSIFLILKQPYLEEFNSYYDHYEFGIQKYEVIISWILLIIKIAIIAFYVHIYAIYPDKAIQVYDQQWHSIFGRQFPYQNSVF